MFTPTHHAYNISYKSIYRMIHFNSAIFVEWLSWTLSSARFGEHKQWESTFSYLRGLTSWKCVRRITDLYNFIQPDKGDISHLQKEAPSLRRCLPLQEFSRHRRWGSVLLAEETEFTGEECMAGMQGLGVRLGKGQ